MTELKLETRRGSQVANDFDDRQPLPGELMEAQSYRHKYSAAQHRPTPVCYTYNCHGLTFASRRTQIISAVEVRKILKEDGYQRIVARGDVMPGDIIIYVADDGDIEHSGVVVENSPGMLATIPRVLSKWGVAHEVIHPFNYCPYSASQTEFYRVAS